MSTPLLIPLQSTPQTLSISLNSVTYNLRVRWNDANQSWVLDISDVNNNPLATGLAMVTGADLLEQLEYLNIGGQLIVQTTNDTDAVPTFFNLGDAGNLYFIADEASS